MKLDTTSDPKIMKAIRTDTNGTENKLLENLQYLEKNPQGNCAVHMHMSALQQANKRVEYMRIVERSFDPVTLTHNSDLFILGDYDIFLTSSSAKINEIEGILDELKTLFAADPLMARKDMTGDDAFCTWYDLEEDLDYFKEAVVQAALHSKRVKISGEGVDMERQHLTPKNLDQISRNFKRLDASPLMRQQSAVQIDPNGQGQLLFREYYVSIGELRQKVAPDVDLAADRWLFQYLTTILDQRVLYMLRASNLNDLPRHISLNLNIQTIHSKDFQLFDKFIADQSDRVILEFQPLDVFADIDAYMRVRDSLHARGYKVLIDSLQPLVLDYFDPSLLEADYYKIAWGDRLGMATTRDGAVEMRDLIHGIGHENVVISHVDGEEAVKFGLQLGVRRFQGFFVDRLVIAMTDKLTSNLREA